MLKISKLTDYGAVIMAWLAREPERLRSATEVAEATRIAAPTVSKILKMLAAQQLVISVRGAHGGYRLARAPAAISVADVICAMEGPVSLTTCSGGACEQEPHCNMAGHWQLINQAISEALAGLTLADLLQAAPTRSAQSAVRVHMQPSQSLPPSAPTSL